MATITTKGGRVYIRLTASIPMNDGKFEFNGRNYDLDADFYPLSWPEFYDDEDGKLHYLSYYEADEWRNPLLLETGEYMDEVSIYREVTA